MLALPMQWMSKDRERGRDRAWAGRASAMLPDKATRGCCTCTIERQVGWA